MKLLIFSLSFFLLGNIAGTLCAQESRQPPFQLIVEGHFNPVVPLGDLQDELSKVGYGGGGSIMGLFRNTPLWLGVKITHFKFDREKVNYEERIDGEWVPFEWRTTTNLLLTAFKARYEFTKLRPVFPFLEGYVGLNRFYTRSVLEDEDFDEVVESGIDHSDWSLTYGGTIGLAIPIIPREGLFLEISGTYMQGRAAQLYVRKEEVPDPLEDPLDAFEERSAVASMFIPRLSISILIDEFITEE